MTVMTVTGPIAAKDLGVTLPHEHLFVDTSRITFAPPEPIRRQLAMRGIDLEAPITMAALGYLTRDPLWSRRVQIVDDEDLLREELGVAAQAGIRTMVDATPHGIGRNAEGLRRLSLATGVHIVAGTGLYRAAFQPDGSSDLSVDQLEAQFERDVVEGIAGTGVRAGVLGELGTSGASLHPVEERVLKASGRVQARHDLPVLVHTEGHVDVILRALDVLEGAGADPGKVCIAHVSGGEHSGWREIVARGARFCVDLFGFEFFKADSRTSFYPTDASLIQNLVKVIDAGAISSVLLSNDICHLTRMHRYGGWGFDHIQTNLEPYLRKAGLDTAVLRRLFVENPARWLDTDREPTG